MLNIFLIISEGMEANMQTENAIDRSCSVLDCCRSNNITFHVFKTIIFLGVCGFFINY